MASDVTAVIVTRGDVPLDRIVVSLGDARDEYDRPTFDKIELWDNSRMPNLSVFGRYAAAFTMATTPWVYVQDDDCLTNAGLICQAKDSNRLVANMPRGRWPDYPDCSLVGWGAVFPRRLPAQAFVRWLAAGIGDLSDVRDRCDLIFSALVPRTIVDVGFDHLPWAETPGRMFKQPGHTERHRLTLDRARIVRDGPDDDRRDW